MGQKGNILVVDDDVDVCDTLKEVLNMEGYDVTTALDGFKALEEAECRKFDAVLMDIKMPKMNGVETFKRLKGKSPGTPVIMVTAYAVEDLIQEALREGAFAALHKPLDFEQLFATIETARGDGALVLIVDDEQAVRTALQKTLNKCGYRAMTARDGETAIKMAVENDFDIIILDMKLPYLNGLETYLAIHDIRPGAVVIVITGHPRETLGPAMQSMESNAFDYLQKPVPMKELLAVMDKIMERKQARNKS